MYRLLLLVVFLTAFNHHDSANLSLKKSSIQERAVDNVNILVDLLMKQFGSIAKKMNLDPFVIGKIDKIFEKTVLFVTFKAGINLKNGQIVGLSSMHRTGDCIVARGDDSVTINADMGVKSLVATADAYVHLFTSSIGTSVKLQANIKDLQIKTVLFQENDSSKNGTVRQFVIKNMDLTVEVVDGSSVFKWVVNKLISFAQGIFSSTINGLIENSAKEALADVLATKRLPF